MRSERTCSVFNLPSSPGEVFNIGTYTIGAHRATQTPGKGNRERQKRGKKQKKTSKTIHVLFCAEFFLANCSAGLQGVDKVLSCRLEKKFNSFSGGRAEKGLITVPVPGLLLRPDARRAANSISFVISRDLAEISFIHRPRCREISSEREFGARNSNTSRDHAKHNMEWSNSKKKAKRDRETKCSQVKHLCA